MQWQNGWGFLHPKWNETIDLHWIERAVKQWCFVCHVLASQNEKRHETERRVDAACEWESQSMCFVGHSGDYSRNFDASTSWWWCWKKELPFATECSKVLQIYDKEGKTERFLSIFLHPRLLWAGGKLWLLNPTGNRTTWSNNTHIHNIIIYTGTYVYIYTHTNIYSAYMIYIYIIHNIT